VASNYPKKAKQPNTNAENLPTAPTAPQVIPVTAPQVVGSSGGAPTVQPFGAPTPIAAPYLPRATTVQSSNSMRQAWNMTGTPNAFNRTFQRTQLQVDPGVVAGSLDRFWNGKGGGAQTPMPTPSAMTMEEAQKYLGDLATSIKAQFDARLKSLPQDVAQRSRFWQMYQQYPEQAATLIARRHWTNQMVGLGPVADWMSWLKG
jgi:hypothetical protein